MRNLKFRLARAKNILCFGEDGIELHFEDYGNVVLVKGVNYDNPGTSDEDRSNASGKSSIPEILSIGLYGLAVKKPTKNKGAALINTLAEKGEVEVQWDDYRVVRTYKKTSSGSSCKIRIWESKDHIWDDDSEVTKGTSRESQKWIEDKVGLSHHAFCSVVIFDDSDRYQFLEMDGPDKREYVENLLDLEGYRQFHANAKTLRNQQNQLISKLGIEYEALKNAIDESQNRLSAVIVKESEWQEATKRSAEELAQRIKDKQESLESSDTGKRLNEWQQAQDRIAELTTLIADEEAKRDKNRAIIDDARIKLEGLRTHRDAINNKLQEHRLDLQTKQKQLKECESLISRLENLEVGAKCPVCHAKIDKNNFGTVLAHAKTESHSCQSEIAKSKQIIGVQDGEFSRKSASIANVEVAINGAEDKYSSMNQRISQLRNELAGLSKLSKPDGTSEDKILEAEIEALKKQLVQKTEQLKGDSPYKDIIAQSEKEKFEKEKETVEKEKEIEAAEKKLPYYEFWVKAFSDTGIRKYIVDGIIPALNARIAYWLQFLIDSCIELTFDNQLEETITRNGNPARYSAASKGEGRRVNLSVSQAFAYVMMLNSGSCPSLVFLDEITGGSIDRAGVVGIYNMVFELAKERQVFVTTHNENLLTMLQGCETIRLEKRDDITRLVS